MAERAILFHGDVLLVGPVMTLFAGPHGTQVHQGSTGDNANWKLGLASWANADPEIVKFVF